MLDKLVTSIVEVVVAFSDVNQSAITIANTNPANRDPSRKP